MGVQKRISLRRRLTSQSLYWRVICCLKCLTTPLTTRTTGPQGSEQRTQTRGMKKLFSELSPAEVSWSISYVCIAWMGELGNGAIQTITGPMQPFLAYNLQTNT